MSSGILAPPQPKRRCGHPRLLQLETPLCAAVVQTRTSCLASPITRCSGVVDVDDATTDGSGTVPALCSTVDGRYVPVCFRRLRTLNSSSASTTTTTASRITTTTRAMTPPGKPLRLSSNLSSQWRPAYNNTRINQSINQSIEIFVGDLCSGTTATVPKSFSESS